MYHDRLRAVHKLLDVLALGRVPTHKSVIAELDDIARLRYRFDIRSERGIHVEVVLLPLLPRLLVAEPEDAHVEFGQF